MKNQRIKFVNLTPHNIRVRGIDGATSSTDTTIAPSGEVARVSVNTQKTGNVEGLPVMVQSTGNVEGLPLMVGGAVFVVSAMVRLAMPDRTDVCSPGVLIRDDSGQPVGCVGLVFNQPTGDRIATPHRYW